MAMAQDLEDAIARLRSASAEDQALAVDVLNQVLSRDEPAPAWNDDALAQINEGRAQLQRGEGVSMAQVRALLDQYRP